MESINSIFLKNSFVNYPNKTKKTDKPKYKDIFDKENNDSCQYLDVLFSDKTEDSKDIIGLTEFFKSHLPIKSKILSFGELFL